MFKEQETGKYSFMEGESQEAAKRMEQAKENADANLPESRDFIDNYAKEVEEGIKEKGMDMDDIDAHVREKGE